MKGLMKPHQEYYFYSDDVIGRKPEGVAGTAAVLYTKRVSVLTSDTDEIPLSMRSYTKSFVDYALAQAYYLDKQASLGDRFMGMASGEMEKFRSEITPRGKSDPIVIDITDPVESDDQLFYGIY